MVKEKNSRMELSEKISKVEREKNAEILKIKNKLDATKKFFANSNKLVVTSPVTRENSLQIEKNKETKTQTQISKWKTSKHWINRINVTKKKVRKCFNLEYSDLLQKPVFLYLPLDYFNSVKLSFFICVWYILSPNTLCRGVQKKSYHILYMRIQKSKNQMKNAALKHYMKEKFFLLKSKFWNGSYSHKKSHLRCQNWTKDTVSIHL